MAIKYHPTEILEIIQANYRQQQQVDTVVLKGQEFTFETTIFDWRDVCDLVDTRELWKYLNFYFRIDVDRETWMTILEPEDKKTLGDLCSFLANVAQKDIIKPVKLFGNNCGTAAVFKSLLERLKNRGIDVSGIRPSSQLEPLVKRYGGILIEEINQLDPVALPPMDFKTNWVYKWGLRSFMSFIFFTIVLIYIESNWAWLTVAICLIGYGMTWLGARMKPKQASFKDIYTIADLVRRMDIDSRIGRPISEPQ